ncbi:MAG: hypothetical protein IJ268_05615 [Proteobacteria bacterium]|nr:hypothetical protein [Pseudomonadota bacterium]
MTRYSKITAFIFTLCLILCGCTEYTQTYTIPYGYEPCDASQVGQHKKVYHPVYDAINPPGYLYEYICTDLNHSERRLSLIEYYKSLIEYYKKDYQTPIFEHDYYFDMTYNSTYCAHGLNDTHDACKKLHPLEFTPCTESQCADNIAFNCSNDGISESQSTQLLTYDRDCSKDDAVCIKGFCVNRTYAWQYEACDMTYKPRCIDNILVECIDGFTNYSNNTAADLNHPNAKCMTIGDESKMIIPCDSSEVDDQSRQECISVNANISIRYNYFCKNRDAFGPHHVFDTTQKIYFCHTDCDQPCDKDALEVEITP